MEKGPYLNNFEKKSRWKFIKSTIRRDKMIVDEMIDDPDHPECKEILNMVFKYHARGFVKRMLWKLGIYKNVISVKESLKILSRLKPIEVSDNSLFKNWDDVQKFYNVRDFVREVGALGLPV